jgi:hypothetical protein
VAAVVLGLLLMIIGLRRQGCAASSPGGAVSGPDIGPTDRWEGKDARKPPETRAMSEKEEPQDST